LKKILIIDRDGELTNTIEEALSSYDSRLFVSGDFTAGYKIAVRYRPDLILYCIGKSDDWAAHLEKIGKDETLSAIPLLAVAKVSSVEEQRTAMDSGADDYIAREFLESSLISSINKRLMKISQIKQAVQISINTFDEYSEPVDNNDHILVKIGNKLKIIEFSEIACITALKEYSRIVTKENCKIIVRKSLKAWVKMLPAQTFLRIHRATIINIQFIEEITKTNERIYTVRLKNIRETFDFSYRYANIMRRTFPTI
jgi:DNA-binding LytR/AlgR family response regulator